MIVYLPKMVTYLRNNQAVSWPGLKPAMKKLQIESLNHYTTKRQFEIWFWLTANDSFGVVSDGLNWQMWYWSVSQSL